MRGDEGVDERLALGRAGELRERRAVLQDQTLVGGIGVNEGGEHLGQRRLDRRGKAGEFLLRADFERTVEAAQLLKVGKSQSFRARAAPPQLIERELEQRQNGGIPRRSVAQNVVESLLRVAAAL